MKNFVKVFVIAVVLIPISAFAFSACSKAATVEVGTYRFYKLLVDGVEDDPGIVSISGRLLIINSNTLTVSADYTGTEYVGQEPEDVSYEFRLNSKNQVEAKKDGSWTTAILNLNSTIVYKDKCLVMTVVSSGTKYEYYYKK